jgi:Relaxase/Mobilisation nuclease domain
MGLVIKARSRRSVRYWAGHLTNTTDNERIEVIEKHALMAESVRGMLREMRDYGRLSRACQNFMHIASFNPEMHEHLTEEQWQQIYELYEQQRGIPPAQPRFIVEHEKKGRIHRHVVWLRVELATLRPFRDAFPLQVCLAAQKQIEEKLDLTPGNHRIKFGAKIKPWERMRGEGSGIDPHQVTAEITSLFRHSKSGAEFVDALRQHGYQFVHGNRAFCVLDRAGDVHSLVKRIEGINTKELREFLKEVDLSSVPTVEQSRIKRRERKPHEKGRGQEKQAARNRKRAKATCEQPVPTVTIESDNEPAPEQHNEQQQIESVAPTDYQVTEPDLSPNITTVPNLSPDLPDEKTAELQSSASDQQHNHNHQHKTESTAAILPDQPPSLNAGKKNEATGPSHWLFSPGAIKQLWRKVHQALTEPEADEPKPKGRRRGESECDFRRLGRILGRSFNVRLNFKKVARKRLYRRLIIRLTREAWGPPDAHLITTPISNNESDCGNSCETAPARNSHGNNYLSPSP